MPVQKNMYPECSRKYEYMILKRVNYVKIPYHINERYIILQLAILTTQTLYTYGVYLLIITMSSF